MGITIITTILIVVCIAGIIWGKLKDEKRIMKISLYALIAMLILICFIIYSQDINNT